MSQLVEPTEQTEDQHIVDVLIQERAQQLIARPHLWRALRPTILPLLGYSQAIEAVNHASGMSGLEVFHYVSDRIRINVLTEGVEQIPRTGFDAFQIFRAEHDVFGRHLAGFAFQ